MYICNDCGQCFDEPKVVKESRGECWGTTVYENIDVCPICGSDNIEIENENE
jgi:rubrerythrin